MDLRLLPPDLVNKIAAGEVLERPASAVKELIENAIDAGAKKIDVTLNEGGKASLTVTDDGKGMTPDELNLCVERFATSKLPDGDLFDIRFLGFRGEALPSIAAVSRTTITTRTKDGENAWSLTVEGGKKHDLEPASAPCGTKVEVRDLFYAVPARLKFLKSVQTETAYIKEIIEKTALAHPDVSFTLSDETKKRLTLAAVPADRRIDRIAAVIGDEFTQNAVALNVARNGLTLTGYAGVPTFNKATAAEQYFYVNGRAVRDKVLLSAVKGAYRELMPSDRFPALVLFLTLPCEDVDVNVHPTKAEVRFRDANDVRGMIVTAVRQALMTAGQKTSTALATEALRDFSPDPALFVPHTGGQRFSSPSYACYRSAPSYTPKSTNESSLPFKGAELYSTSTAPENFQDIPPAATDETAFPPLGLARAQLHKTYIVSQTADGIAIIDQHAAHERLTYEKIRANMDKDDLPAQYLLLPEIVEVGLKKKEALLAQSEILKKSGLIFDAFGDEAVVVRAIPAVLGETDAKGLICDLADTLIEFGDNAPLNEKIKKIAATMACHGSVRAGRVLDISEMNALLRQMEQVSFSGQCIHGRPTYIELKLPDIEKLFGRRE